MTQGVLERRFSRLAAASNQKARRLGEPGRLTAADLFHAYMDSESLCPYCGIGIKASDCSFDHVIPFGKGGPNTAVNVVACCLTCQRGKFMKSPEQYAAWQVLKKTCPIDGEIFRPRWADHVRGLGRYCSRRCSGTAGGMA